MDAPTLLALAHARLRMGEAAVQNLWASPRALALAWAPDRRAGWEAGLWWIFLIQPSPELWLLRESDPAFPLLKAEAKTDLSRRWAQDLKGARLEDVEGDPRERWVGLTFRRRAITGRIELTRLAFQAVPGRGGLRLDGLDLHPARIGLGTPFPAGAPEVQPDDPPPLRRWRERFGDALDAALVGEIPDILPGEGPLHVRHRAWSVDRSERLIATPRQAAQNRKLVQELKRLDRYSLALKEDRARHEKTLGLRTQAGALAAELYRLRGQQGRVTLLDGTTHDLPEGMRPEEAVQRWFAAIKRAERGLQRVEQLESEHRRRREELAREMGGELPPPPEPRPAAPKGKKAMEKQGRQDKRADGKGKAFRSVMIDGFETLIGKGDADNDTLTFKVASPCDLWLHVANVPGSHVIVRNPDKLSDLPREVVERAAQLAAWYSKAREAGKVEVHVCRVADVSKPRGFAPGKVMLRQYKAVRVYPKE